MIVGVGVIVGLGVDVGCGVGVIVGLGVAVGCGVGVIVGLGVGVIVGVGVTVTDIVLCANIAIICTNAVFPLINILVD